MRKKIISILLVTAIILNINLTANAVEYANFVYNKKLALRVYDSGQVDLIYKKQKYRLADEGRCRFAGIDKYGAVYLLMINDCLYGFDYKNKKQKKVELIRLDEEVKKVKQTDYGYVKSYKKYNNKTYKITKKYKKRLWKKALKSK